MEQTELTPIQEEAKKGRGGDCGEGREAYPARGWLSV